MKVIFMNLICANCHAILNTWSSNGQYVFCESDECPEKNVKYKYPTMELEKYET